MSCQGEETTFTLSIGGVEFCLAPAASAVSVNAISDAGDVMSVSKICNGEVLISLNNFIGTLRVRNDKRISALTSSCGKSALPLQPASDESPVANENQEENNHTSNETSSPTHDDEKSVDAVAKSVAAAPAAVEDTPSPQAKTGREVKPKEEKPKQRKGGQQKLNFFGKHEKKQGKTYETQNKEIKRSKSEIKKPAVASKRKSTEDTTESSSNMKKKPFKGNNKTEPKVSPDNSELNDFIEEPTPKNDESGKKNLFSFTLASFGQEMLSSQEVEFMKDEDGVFSLESSKTEQPRSAADDKLSKVKPTSKEAASAISRKSAQETAAPCPRWGQTMTMIDHRRFIIYGGQTIDKDSMSPKPLSDLFVYDLMDHMWTKPINCDGIARTWHTANFLPERQLLLCFGGEVLDDTSGRMTTTDQVMVLDCEIMLWYPPTVSGQVPSGRSGHASCVLPVTNELVVFGGVKNGKWLNSVSILDTHRWKWSALKALGDAPPPRSYHSATAIATEAGNRVVIFGGNNGSKCFNSVHVLETTWEGKRWVWSNPKCKGEAPPPRTGHNATLLSDGLTILVYGGWDPNTEDENGDDLIFGDSFLLDTKMWSWRKGPNPRYEMSGKNNVMNGGAGRVGHSAVLAPGSNGVQVLAFGGRLQENKFAADFQSLTVPM